MRQFRTSGSVEGVTGNRHLYSDSRIHQVRHQMVPPWSHHVDRNIAPTLNAPTTCQPGHSPPSHCPPLRPSAVDTPFLTRPLRSGTTLMGFCDVL
jgi:hypothetical protein